jgi:DNA-binding transcriptional ArsR family regulator
MLDSLRQYKAGIFQALGNPTRIAMIELLNDAELSVSQLCGKLGLEQSNASQHLAVLRKNHIVQTRKHGNQIYYSLSDPIFGQLLKSLRAFFLSHVTEALKSLQEEDRAGDRASLALKSAGKDTRRVGKS